MVAIIVVTGRISTIFVTARTETSCDGNDNYM